MSTAHILFSDRLANLSHPTLPNGIDGARLPTSRTTARAK